MCDVGHGGKKLNRLIDLHLQHIANAFTAPADRQRFGVEACAMTAFTQHLHIGQEAHFNGSQALPFAGVTTAFAGVKAESARTVSARFGFKCFGKQFANGVPKTNISGGTTAWRFANRGLVHFEHAVNGLVTV